MKTLPKPADFPESPKFGFADLLLGDEVRLRDEGHHWYTIVGMDVVGYDMYGQGFIGEAPSVRLHVLGHPVVWLTPSDVVARRLRPDSKGRSAGHIDESGRVRYG